MHGKAVLLRPPKKFPQNFSFILSCRLTDFQLVKKFFFDKPRASLSAPCTKE